jgi:hypothetical protein
VDLQRSISTLSRYRTTTMATTPTPTPNWHDTPQYQAAEHAITEILSPICTIPVPKHTVPCDEDAKSPVHACFALSCAFRIHQDYRSTLADLKNAMERHNVVWMQPEWTTTVLEAGSADEPLEQRILVEVTAKGLADTTQPLLVM